MNTQFLYLTDPLTMTFQAEIKERKKFADGGLGVILSQTYFYPTGGGQEYDTGWLGKARVVNVIKSEEGDSVLHILDHDPGDGLLNASIDHDRRLRHMQHHTAQHLLSGCFQQTLNLETLSSGIHGTEPTTIDFPDTQLSRADLDLIEDLANKYIYENLDVKSYFIPSEQIMKVPLRRPPKVSGDIRIVEIDSIDFSACGATHCVQTGMIGSIKIIRTERINQKTRIHFVAGIQALEYFRKYQRVATTLAFEMSSHPDDVIELVGKQAKQLQKAEKELRHVRDAYSTLEARDLLTNAEHIGDYRLILKTFEKRPVNEIRSLGNDFKEQAKLVSMLATFDGSKLVLIVTCGPDTTFSARELLLQQLAAINGRGGGDHQIAQGGGATTPDQFSSFFMHTKKIIQQTIG